MVFTAKTTNKNCDKDATKYLQQENLFSWRGTKPGCFSAETLHPETCKDYPGGDDIAAQTDVYLNLWKTMKICTETFKKTEYALRVGTTCPTEKPTKCGCYCFQGTDCPISEWGIYPNKLPPDSKTNWKLMNSWLYDGLTKWFQWRRADDGALDVFNSPQNLQPFSLLPQIELYSTSCINPDEHPADPSTSYLLYSILYKGCNIFGDDPYSIQADDQKQWSFYNDNKDLMGTRLTLKNYKTNIQLISDLTVKLVNRQQIQRKCTASCLDFKFNEGSQKVIDNYNLIWGFTKWIAIFSLISSSVLIYMLLLVAVQRLHHTSQSFFFFVYVFAMVCMFLIFILCWRTKWWLDGTFITEHSYYKAFLTENCIVNEKWKNVL